MRFDPASPTPARNVAAQSKWSHLQEAFFTWFVSGSGNLMGRARAGTGKSTTLLEGVNRAPESNIWIAAFNKLIADDMGRKLNNPCAVAKTMHGIGLACIKRRWGDEAQGPDNDRSYRIAEEVLRDVSLAISIPLPRRILDVMLPEADIAPRADRGTVQIVAQWTQKLKEVAPFSFRDPPTQARQRAEEVAAQFDLLPEEDVERRGWSAARIAAYSIKALDVAAAFADRRFDFADMIFLPLVNGWTYPRFDMICVDECLPYRTPVLLSDGTSRDIGDIVKLREAVEVMSYDTNAGEQVKRRVTGWQEIPNRKPLVKVSARRPRKGGGPPTRDFVTCTIDHKIWTCNRGWVAAGDLIAGDRVQVETAAKKSHWYKIRTVGRKHLGELRASKDRPNRGESSAIKPHNRGGNGRPPPRSEVALQAALGADWVIGHVVPTGAPRVKGSNPSHFKIDIANPECKIAVEVDGASHGLLARKEQDRRKEDWLKAQGWRVFRFSKRVAWQDPEACAAQVKSVPACPVEAVVVSVDPIAIRDDFVYDLTIEGTHCFYANGILVHNCQDTNDSSLKFIMGMLKSGGRMALIGDEKQSLYKFRGADSGAMERLKKQLNAIELPLTISYRCPLSVIREAQRIVPDIEARPGAPEGIVRMINFSKLASEVQPGDLVLSRVNAMLMKAALGALQLGKPVTIIGRELGEVLIKLIKRIDANKCSLKEFLKSLEEYRKEQTQELGGSDERSAKSKLERILDQVDALDAVASSILDAGTGKDTFDLVMQIRRLFTETDEKRVTSFATVHKIKGKESNRVFILRDTLYVYGMKKGDPDEANIEYVAITRAKEELIWVDGGVKKKTGDYAPEDSAWVPQ